ncbi:MAG TPA: DUF2158 domain-containing protein [Bradyrhizobium sp.]|uniref:YodC family protein n=1 Tax=Bradyrhizobium sp. TaxID=376 RepID=UPI002D80669F|nr:DUF2158 domain-containing protein [Bradyrhizobium sp.]HET7887262.1 DUF2158 domain-containing protein [Bradyrhizobium sp.]
MIALRPGDLVVLKSGGPVMTVDAVNTDIFDDDKVTGILCAWFVGTKLERARFDPGALIAAPSPEASSEQSQTSPTETSGAYKAILDEMVAAMNDPAEAPGEASKTPGARPKQTSGSKRAAEDRAEASGTH